MGKDDVSNYKQTEYSKNLAGSANLEVYKRYTCNNEGYGVFIKSHQNPKIINQQLSLDLGSQNTG